MKKKVVLRSFIKFILFSLIIIFSFSTFSCSEKRQNLKLREKIKIKAVTENIDFWRLPFIFSFTNYENEFKKTEETYVNVFKAKTFKPATYYFELINLNFEDIYLTEAQIITFLLSNYHLTLNYENFYLYFLTKGENPYTKETEFYYVYLVKNKDKLVISNKGVVYDYELIDYYDCSSFEHFGSPKLFIVTKR